MRWSQNLKGRDQLEDLYIDERILRMDLREIWWEGEDWIHLT
jgi:hypothetical protein